MLGTNTPPIKPFIDNFSFVHLRAPFLANKNDTLIYLYIEGELLTYTELNSAFITYYNDVNEVNGMVLNNAMHGV